MDLNDTPEQAAFRARVRAWIETHRSEAPPLPQGGVAGIPPADRATSAGLRAWQSALATGGLAGVAWPVRYGGQGLTQIEQEIASAELADAGLAGVFDQAGVGWLGPTLIAHGSDAQRERYLRPMLHADEIWAQLFSEPEAGSDLAAVRTRARREPDGGWRISGQKVWTTNADLATLGLLLARSDPDVPKHQGLTMFVVPMDVPEVTVRPLRQITGEAEFSEVFLDDVPLPADAAVGTPGGGWGVALATLGFERMTLSLRSGGPSFRPERFVRAIASDPDARRDPLLRRRMGELAAELLAIRFSGHRIVTALQQGQAPGLETALTKLTMDSAAIDAVELIVDALGPAALDEGSEWAYMTSYLPGQKTGGGTEPILRNTIGERVLGLEQEPRLDKGVSFTDLLAREQAQRGEAQAR